jgi:hypothetical protein
MMTEIDLAALKKCMKIAVRDKKGAKQIEMKLKSEAWYKVAEFAAYSVQCDALGLMPHEEPPCVCDEGDPGKAAELLRRLLAAGLSRYEPDPLAALQ